MTSYHPAFETVSERELGEYRSVGILLRHRATGCEIFRLANEDAENVFAFAFRTGPRDGTGVAHIVEHSVLCGSRRYPLKDPFIAMSRRSLATFMNAFTYSDKTVYPAASIAPADYFNLMDVFGDAVFHPLLSEDCFLQEAHHLELGEDGKLDMLGVVYNEMRGDYSSLESLASTASVTGLFSPGHPYSFDSGGDPEDIPTLDYEGFRSFWAEHYHPSNCKIYLYGNTDTGRQLAFLEERFLSGFGRRPASREIPIELRRDRSRRIELPCPVADGAESATSIIVNWLTMPVTDGAEALAMEVLAEILLGHDGAPLAKALRDSGLGEDLSPQCGIDTGHRQIIFSAGLRGASRGKEAEIEDLIASSLGSLVAEGFGGERLETALHSIAFANREIRRGSGAYGFRLFNRAARGWLHGMSPEATLSFEEPLAELKARLAGDPRYLESLAEKYLLSNPHRTTVTAFPEPGLLEREESRRRAQLDSRAALFAPAEAAALRERSARLAAAQSTADGPEALATLPRLKLAELSPEIEVLPRERAYAAGAAVSVHPLFTNGIVYLDLAFPLDALAPESLLWLPLLARFIAGSGLPGLPYHLVAERLAREAGGFGAILESGTHAGISRQGGTRSFALFRLKALEEKFPAALDLALSLLAGADFGDASRVSDLYAELRNDVVSAIVPAGNSFALARAGASLTEALAVEELWRGPSQLEFLLGLKRSERDGSSIAAELAALAGTLFSRSELRVGLTVAPEGVDAALGALERGLAASLPTSAHPSLGGAAPASAGGPPPQAAVLVPAPQAGSPAARSEAFSLSCQVGFAAAACAGSRLGEEAFAHEVVLAHLLTTGALWEELRVRRGAYSASCSPDGLEGVFSFSSYRDPSPVDSLVFFGEALAKAAEGLGPEEVEEAAVGAVGKDLRPLLPEEKGFADFRRELYGIDDDKRRAKRAAMLAVGPEDLAAAARRLAWSYQSASMALISHAQDVELMRRSREGTRVTELPI
jgi:Zn-dependent M16 (insulinase) family peptidase